MNKMRVAFIMTGIGYGGASKSLLLLLKYLKKFETIETFVFAQFSNAPEIEREIKESCTQLKIFYFPHLNYNQAYKSSEKDLDKIRREDFTYVIEEVLKYNVDILHINSTTLSYLLPDFKKQNSKLKVVTHLREVIPNANSNNIAQYLIENIINFSDHIIAITDNEFLPFEGNKNISVIPNPFDFSLLQEKGSEKTLYQKNTNEIVLGMMGDFHHSKGHFLFLEMINILVKKAPNKKVKGIILGVKQPKHTLKYFIKRIIGKDYFTNIKKYISKNNLGEIVTLLESVDSVLPFLNTLDIYVRPSKADDPWGRDIIEAMALKKPVVATGTSEFFVKNGLTGHLVTPKDPEVMADKILELINNLEKRKVFGENGYKLVKEMCDLENYGVKIVSIYNNLLKSI